MPVINCSLKKVSAERTRTGIENVNVEVKNNIKFLGVNEVSDDFRSDQWKTIAFSFIFFSGVYPDIGKIRMEIEVVAVLEDKVANDYLDNWVDLKRINDETYNIVSNMALTKAQISALALSRDLGLPPPVRLPQPKTKNRDATGSSSKGALADLT